MRQYKYNKKRTLVKFCPCGKSNSNGKFAPFENFERFGHCFSCDRTLFPDDETARPFDTSNIPTPQPSFHSLEIVEKTVLSDCKNFFIEYLETIFSPDEVRKAVRTYLIGTWDSWKGAAVFWQIDQLERVHHGKVMMFNPETGKRLKRENGTGVFSTVRSLLKLDDFNINQSLFGLHLINENTKAVALVESEKTAVIMSIFKPEYTWLATGSKGGFKHDFLKSIKQCKIVAFPDKGEYKDWSTKADKLNFQGFKITVNDWLEHQDLYNTGDDLADVYINESKKTQPSKDVKTSDFDKINFTELYNNSKAKAKWEAEQDTLISKIKYSSESIKVHHARTEKLIQTNKTDITKTESNKAIQDYIDNL